MTQPAPTGAGLRRRWLDGDVTFGGWCSIADPFVTEIMGRSGFDWLCLDMQHGLMGFESLLAMLQAADAAGVPALVRVPDGSGPWIPRVLDAGAAGVIVPMVDTGEDASSIVAAARYAPAGSRSWGPTRASLRSAGYSATTANDSSLVVVMIETPAGVRHADEIMATAGVDAVFIGPADLALSHSWTAADDRSAGLVDELLAAGARHGVPMGIFCQDVAEVRRYAAAGVAMIAVLSDLRLLRGAAAAALESARATTG